MPILASDIKLLASQRMTDNDDGGGRVTGTEIADGAHNTIFPDISDVDLAYGRVNLRKMFMAVQTDDTDSYFGGNLIVLNPPSADNVSTTLFATKSATDERTDAKDFVERYLARGPRWLGYLYDTQLSGQRAIRLIQRSEQRLPNVGETLVLVGNEGDNDEFEQYVRITSVSSEVRTFTVPVNNSSETFTRTVVTAEISDALRYTFEGNEPTPFDNADSPTTLRETVVADAAKYYATVPLADDAAFGALQVKADQIFTQLVPSARSETGAVDVSPAATPAAITDAAQGTVTSTHTAQTVAPSASLYLGNPAVPGSVSVSVGGATINDNGGELVSGGSVIGEIDYEAGKLTFNATCPNYGTATKTVTFRPAAAPGRIADTLALPVSSETRGYIYTATLKPIPAPGTLTVSYMAQGKWYVLTDNGKGELAGTDSAYGSGTVSFTTGSVMVTLGALPDVGSAVMLSWATAVSYLNRSDVTPGRAGHRLALSESGITPASVSVSWGAGLVAIDDGLGNLSGDATGSVDYASGEVVIQPDALVAGGTEFTVDYQSGPPTVETAENIGIDGNNQAQMALVNGGVIPYSLAVTYQATSQAASAYSSSSVITLTVRDDGAGNLLLPGSGQVVGSIDYATGLILLDRVQPSFMGKEPVYEYPVIRPPSYSNAPMGNTGATYGGGTVSWPANRVLVGYQDVQRNYLLANDGSLSLSASYRYSASDSAHSDLLSADMELELTPGFAERIIAGSVRFILGGATYVDRLGMLYRNLDPATGAGELAGSIDYASGKATLTAWTSDQANGATLKGLLTEIAGQPVDGVTFRTPGAPIRPGSLYLSGAAADGSTIEVTADTDGTLFAAGVAGQVDYDAGIVDVRFGDLVTAAGNEGEDWYDPANVDGNGNIWKPLQVFADTLRFNCVVYTYLPLDADLIGLDPVRLPSDGQVPVFRPGELVVVHSTDTTAVAPGASAGQVIDTGEVRLSMLRIEDAGGVELDSALYSADLDAGTVTLADPLDLTGYTEPLSVVHRIEDMSLVSDVEIGGNLSLVRPLSHNFAAATTFVSSALIAGDLAARVANLFDQSTWTSTWSDTLIGSEPSAQFNDTTYPVTVTNRGAITERWALIFTSNTAFKVVGESVGQIAVGDINSDCAPLNPNTNVPYFTIPSLGWGSGWASGNVLRFNTIGAIFPMWIARTILQAQSAINDDQFALQLRGNVNTD